MVLGDNVTVSGSQCDCIGVEVTVLGKRLQM